MIDALLGPKINFAKESCEIGGLFSVFYGVVRTLRCVLIPGEDR